jgi:hypothetical protein
MVAAPLVTWLDARFGWRIALVGTAVVGLSWVPVWLALTRRPWARRLLAPGASAARSTTEGAFRWTRLVSHPAVLRAVLVTISIAPAMQLMSSWGAKVLVTVHHVSQRDVGHFLWLPPVALDLGAIGFGAVATLRHRALTRASRAAEADAPQRLPVGVAAALGVSISLISLARSPWETTLVFSLILASGGGLYGLATADMLRRIPSAWVAPAGGVVAAAQALALICVNPIIGAARDAGHSFGAIAVVLGLWVLPGPIVWIVWDPRRSGAGEVEALAR